MLSVENSCVFWSTGKVHAETENEYKLHETNVSLLKIPLFISL